MDIIDNSFLAIIIIVIKGGTLRYVWAMECVIANIPLYYLSIYKKVNMEYTFNFTTETTILSLINIAVHWDYIVSITLWTFNNDLCFISRNRLV